MHVNSDWGNRSSLGRVYRDWSEYNYYINNMNTFMKVKI